jgi:hypothetical protein
MNAFACLRIRPIVVSAPHDSSGGHEPDVSDRANQRLPAGQAELRLYNASLANDDWMAPFPHSCSVDRFDHTVGFAVITDLG